MLTSPADFPQVWQKPPFADLLACLESLRFEPPVWNPGTSRRKIIKELEISAHHRRQVAAYLGSIVKSSLAWIEDNDEKEVLWEEASRRLSERCGRAGMGDITRRWSFAGQNYPAFELIIKEPTMTGGDALGLKTWGSSYVLAQLLDQIGTRSLSHLLSAPPASSPAVLELGSGTGLLGMAAAAIWKARVALTDLPNIVPNLSANVEENRATIESFGGHVSTGALTWGGSGEDDGELFSQKNRFKIVLVADPIYDDNHPSLLAGAIRDHLMDDSKARAVVMVPLRDSTTRRLLLTFCSTMAEGSRSLPCLEEHTVVCQDDWDEDVPEVECWWGIFGSP